MNGISLPWTVLSPGGILVDVWQASDPFWQVLGLKPAPQLPATPAPVLQPPPAPQTAAKMRTWSPDDSAEASAQRQGQFGLDTRYMQSNWSQAKESTPAPVPPGGSWSPLLLALGAAGAIAAIALIRRI